MINKKRSKQILSLHLLVFIICATLFLLSFPQQVSSLGVAPSLFNLDNPEKVVELKLKILNSQQEDLFVTISPEGSLSEYVELEKRSYRLSPQEKEKIIYYKLRIPADPLPGQNVLSMYVLQVDDFESNGDSDSAQLNAKVSVVQRVNVHIPYPGEYLAGNLFVQSKNLDDPVSFMLHLINKGDQDVTTSGKITIKGSTNQVITTLIVPETTVAASTDKKITVSLENIENAGEYYSEAYLEYGGEELLMRKTFAVGNKYVEAYNLAIESFTLGEIVKVVIDVNSEWNQLIEGLIAKGKVIDPETSEVLSVFESNTVDISVQGITKIIAYWDTEDLPPGLYDVDVQLHYDNKITQNFFDTVVSSNSIQIARQGFTGQVISSPNDNSKSTEDSGLAQPMNLLIFLVFGLIIAVVILFIKIKKKK